MIEWQEECSFSGLEIRRAWGLHGSIHLQSLAAGSQQAMSVAGMNRTAV